MRHSGDGAVQKSRTLKHIKYVMSTSSSFEMKADAHVRTCHRVTVAALFPLFAESSSI